MRCVTTKAGASGRAEAPPEGGCIINTSSINGLRGNKALIDYAAAG